MGLLGEYSWLIPLNMTDKMQLTCVLMMLNTKESILNIYEIKANR